MPMTITELIAATQKRRDDYRAKQNYHLALSNAFDGAAQEAERTLALLREIEKAPNVQPG